MSKIICGKNSIIEAINNDWEIERIFSLKPLNFDTKNIPISITTKERLDAMSNNSNHQGVVAIVKSGFQYYSIEEIIKENPQIILVLDHLEDSRNIGAILRTANAAGVKHIIIPSKRSAEINATALKVSSGGFVNLKIVKVASLQSVVEKLKKKNYWIYSSILNEQAKNYSKINYNFPLCLIVGNEAKGVSKTLIKASDEFVYIPMKGTVQSLNVSVATGIILFEIIKKIS